MEPSTVRTRLMLASATLFGVMLITAYLQSVLHFDTYLALAICMVDTVVAAMILFNPEH